MYEEIQDILFKDWILRRIICNKGKKIIYNRSYNIDIFNESIKLICSSYWCKLGITWYGKTDIVKDQIESERIDAKIKGLNETIYINYSILPVYK